MPISLDLAKYGVTDADIRASAAKLTGMFPSQDLSRYKGPDVLTFEDLRVRTKEQGLVTFRPRRIQQIYLDLLFGGDRWKTDPTGLRGVRDIILKGRQFGISTLLMALYFIETVQTPYTSTVIIAHDRPTVERMFQTVKRFYNHLPADKKPETKYNNKAELYWPEIDSSFFIGQAGSVSFGAGLTINNVHCSEIPRWPDARTLMTAIMESVPPSGNITMESTARGYDGYFQPEWDRAVEGDSGFTPRFFSWVDHEEYKIDVKAYEAEGKTVPKKAVEFLREGPTKEETEIKETFKLTDEQLMWMRWKKADQREYFPQEYPLTPEEAFVSTGNPYFDLLYLTNLNRILKSSEFDPLSEEEVVIPEWWRVLAKNRADLEVWELPKVGGAYVIGADPAEGVNKHGDKDYCTADVFDARTRVQVAHFHSRVPTHEFGIMLSELGWWYGEALLCVERNNHGHAVLDALIHTAGYPFMDETKQGGLYLHSEVDKQTNLPGLRPGWPTYRPQKNHALDTLDKDLNDRALRLNCRGTVGELMRFVKVPGGRAEGADGSHDDRVSSLMLANMMLNVRPAFVGDYVAGGYNRSIVQTDDGSVSVGGVSRTFVPPHSPLSRLGR